MDLVAGAMGNLAPKLLHLLKDEYNLHKGVKTQVRSLARELESMHLALCEVAKVPYDQLKPQVKLWASDVREASYDMEDILDTFLVRVDDGCHQPTDNVCALIKKMRKKFSLRRLKARHDVAGAIEDIKKQVSEMTERRNRFMVDDVVGKSAKTTSIDPRLLMALRIEVSDLVGIDEPKDEIVKMLNLGDDKKMKIISVVGPGGLGKTTLARVVYDKLTMDMDFSCKAFVSVGQNPDLKKVFKDILHDLDKSQYMNNINYIMTLDETQLIKEIQAFLKEKRYFVVIDDVWEAPLWKNIRVALEDNNLGSKIMITTRRSDVAELGHCTYKMQPLRPDSSKVLFYGRIFGSQDRCPEILSEVSDKILKKCNGVPLAIITVASLLANKSDDITEWQEVCSSIGSGLSSNNDMYNDMRKILLLSYYDLPPDMKTCFLYLSMYPEDHAIGRDQLIWTWISEGFIQPQKGVDDLFELGKSYFNDLINRSLVQPIGPLDEIWACRVHDMILDLICSLSREENFVTTSNGIEQLMSSESKKLRRLSLKNAATWPKEGIAQLRSIAVFGDFIDSTPSFSCLDMLRVLDLEDCSLENCGGPKLYLGDLIHLRYLNLRGTGLKVLPRGIEKLQFLQVLLMGPNYLVELPEPIFRLRRLMCLVGVRCCPRPGNLLRNLTSLQVLARLYVLSVGAVEAMGHLTQLTRLSIDIKLVMVDQSFCDALMNSLCNMPRLSDLEFKCKGFYMSLAPPPHLCEVQGSSLQTPPKWINIASSLPHLTYLFIKVHSVRPNDIQILGMLPNLLFLRLKADRQNYLEQPLQKFVVSPDAFPRVKWCKFVKVIIVPSMFTRGALPRVEVIRFGLRPRDFFSNHAQDGLEFDDLAMDHLPLLREVDCSIYTDSPDTTKEEEVEKLRAAVKQAAEEHPNHPELLMRRK